MITKEIKAIICICAIYACRMLGLAMLLPVFSVYANNLSGSTPMLIGLALGIYGLTQAAMQIPMGLMSDKWGRKPIIIFGLGLFILGNLVAAMSTSILGIIIGRAIQGAGAIGSTLLALLADSTSVTQRTRAMAMVGMSIGLSFGIAMCLGPFLAAHYHLSSLFWTSALLAIWAIALLLLTFPRSPLPHFHSDTQTSLGMLKSVLRDKRLLKLDVGIFIQHAILTAMFVAMPLTLLNTAGIHQDDHWSVYLPILIVSFISMLPLMILAEKYKLTKPCFLGAISAIILAQLSFRFLSGAFWEVAIALYIYFTAFNLLEAMLPSQISKTAPKGAKGTTMGVYSTAQFLGIFAGGSLAGVCLSHYGTYAIYTLCSGLGILWISAVIAHEPLVEPQADTSLS